MLLVDHSSWDYWGCHSCLSDTVLNAESLTILNLEYVTTTSDDSIWLPSLKSLSLDKVQLSDLGFFHFFRCPSIDNISVSSCFGFSNHTVSSSFLKSLEFG
ncbi:hypothetical protein PS2_036387 [Malus domestica]